jgi:hypothetical protein
MNIDANFEHRASSSRGKHEGESSFALCDRLGRTRDNSQRQLPTDHDYAVPTREYQTDQSSLKLLRLLLALSSRKGNYKAPTNIAELTWSLHIRPMRSSRSHWFVFRVDGRQTAPYSPAPDSDHVLWTRNRLNHRTCRNADFSCSRSHETSPIGSSHHRAWGRPASFLRRRLRFHC